MPSAQNHVLGSILLLPVPHHQLLLQCLAPFPICCGSLNSLLQFTGQLAAQRRCSREHTAAPTLHRFTWCAGPQDRLLFATKVFRLWSKSCHSTQHLLQIQLLGEKFVLFFNTLCMKALKNNCMKVLLLCIQGYSQRTERSEPRIRWNINFLNKILVLSFIRECGRWESASLRISD